MLDGLQALLGDRDDLSPAMETFLPAKELIEASPAPPAQISNLKALRDEVTARFPQQGLGSLLSEIIVNRDQQMRRLCQLGKEPMLVLIAQGYMLPDISRGLNVSYQLVKEFAKKTCTPQELSEAEEMGAEYGVHNALNNLSDAYDRDEIAKARALFEAKVKVAKAYTSKFNDKQAAGPVQINNFNDNSTGVPTLMTIVGLSEDEELPPLKEHNHLAQEAAKPELPDIEDGIFETIS